jgi:hypothetical protein
MDIEYYKSTLKRKERREYESKEAMMEDAEKESQNPGVKKLTLHFPKLTIPKKRR